MLDQALLKSTTKRAQQHPLLNHNGCLQLRRLIENIRMVLTQHQLEMCPEIIPPWESTLCKKGLVCCARSQWLANLAAVRNEPFRAISVHVNLTPPTITKTSRSNHAHIIKAKYFCQRVLSTTLPSHAPFSGEYFIPVKETFQTYVSNNHSVKILECPEHFPLCFLSLFWYASY